MKLIADCGGSKCLWMPVGYGCDSPLFSGGFNPALMSRDDIVATFCAGVPEGLRAVPFEEVWIYAAGCRSQREESALREAALSVWPGAKVSAASDMLGAARAVCGHADGIACILGTGSNCAVYSAERGIVASTPPLGYVLGDEGSGADIGKAIVNHVLKRRWGAELCEKFVRDTTLSQDDIIYKVYRQPEPNRFLASLTRWAAANIGQAEVAALVIGRFRAFIVNNIAPLAPPAGLSAGFVGSVAAVFERKLRQAAAAESLAIGRILKSPEQGLVEFHR